MRFPTLSIKRIRHEPAALTGLLCFALLVSLLLLHGHVINGWWRWDDPTHLFFITQHLPHAYFFDPQVWRAISPVNFTPLLNLSFQIDYWLYGLSPSAFYIRQLVVLWLCSVMTLQLLRLWLPPGWAFCAALLFIVAAPVMFVAEQLMTRHYADGLLLAISALYLFVRALRAPRYAYSLALAAACLYLLAVLAKEVYAPLAVLLPFIREGQLTRRLRLWLPTLMMVGIYVIWRQHMLASTGGYGLLNNFSPMHTLSQLANIPLLLFGQHAIGMAATLAAFISILAVALTPSTQCYAKHYSLLLVCLGAGFILLPLVPLTLWPGIRYPDRYLLLPWWSLSIGIAWGLAVLAQRSHLPRYIAIGCAIFLLASAAAHTLRLKEPLHAVINEQQTQGRFIWQADAQEPVWLSPALAATLWEYQYVTALREIAGNGPAPMLIADESRLEEYWETHQPSTVWRYQPECGCMQDVADQIPALLEEWRSRLRPGNALEADIHIEDQLITWRFGPYEEGSYSLMGPQLGRIPLPATGQLRTSIELENIRLRYDAPDGTVRYSGPITLMP